MSLFGSKEKKKIQVLQRELIASRKENKRLKKLCYEKDDFFTELISDGLRHGSKLAAKHMADRKKFLNGK